MIRACVDCGAAFVPPNRKNAKCPACKLVYDRAWRAKRGQRCRGPNHPVRDQAWLAARVRTCPKAGCWLWTKSVNAYGYGNYTDCGVTKLAHRLSWSIFRGEIPAGMFVCHRCDVPACCNPDHLFLGTQRENLQDMANKGRHNRLGGAKLNEAQVLEILALDSPQRLIAANYGISPSNVSRIKTRSSWRHIKCQG